jgi:ABC-type glutathione transport system ATPase component
MLRSPECGVYGDELSQRGATTAAKLEVRAVSKIFRRDGRVVHALDPVSLTIPDGRLVSLIGPSGCGKSTLFSIIAGLREDVVEGLGKAPRAFIGLLRGENFGKLLVRVARASS